MRIAWVCPYPPNALSHLSGLRPASHPAPWLTVQAPRVAKIPDIELHVISVSKELKTDHHFEEHGICFHFLHLPRVPRVSHWYQLDRRKVHRCLRDIQPDLVHGFGTESSYSYAAVTSPYSSLVMIQGVNSEIYKSLGSLRWRRPHLVVPLLIERYTVRRCRDFICETNFSAAFVRRLNPNAKIHLLRTPVRPEFFSVQRNPTSDAPLLLFVGSVIPEKGIEVLLNSFAELLKDFPKAHLRVIGHCEPAYEQLLKSLMERLGITEHVTMCGYLNVEEVTRHFAEATLLVLPSFMDTAPNVVAEAQVAGLPVVATRVGGIPEMIEADVSGVLVSPRSVESLTEGVSRLLNDAALRESIAAVAQERAQSQCSPDIQVAKLVDIYRSIPV